VHDDIGHLGIFVSGKVAKKEHAQIVSVLKSVEALPPGLYAMKVEPTKDGYAVSFTERRLEEIVERLNRFKRADERPFEAVTAVSDFNQRAYELFARPLVKALATEEGAKLSRDLHPLRFQRSFFSDRNPWLAWLAPAAEMVKAQRQALGPNEPVRQPEKMLSEVVSASLDYYRAVRDALSEAAFFQLYGNVLPLPEKASDASAAAPVALPSIAEGGYPAALARVAVLLARKGEPLPLSRIELKRDLLKDYRDYLPALAPEDARRIRGEQEVLVRREPEQAIEALPQLVVQPNDRERLLALIERLLADGRVQDVGPTDEQLAMLSRIRGVLGVPSRRSQRVTH
jgi:hypothetical protein